MKNLCENCKYATYTDYGYSNYTVEGTDFECAKKLHPGGIFDAFFNKAPEFKLLEDCSGFEEGDTIHMDVDGEELADLTPEQLEIWNML
jgi:hypothetical protein